MNTRPRIIVVGAGLAGRRHIEQVRQCAQLAAIVDPVPKARQLAKRCGVRWFAELGDCLGDAPPDGAIIATPNHLHVPHATACIAAGIPCLVEKPVADNSARAARLAEASAKAGVPVLVGHHRRYNPLIKAAKTAIEGGKIGRIVTVSARFWLYKPNDYFAQDWRTGPGAGPIFINLIHDIDLLRHLCGEITGVQAAESSRIRGHQVEDTAAVILGFENGALGTVTLSDTVVAPWSWEFSAGENPAYPDAGAECYAIGGTWGSLSIPDLAIWSHPGRRGWWEPIKRRVLRHTRADPLTAQLKHFVAVIRGRTEPEVDAEEGMHTLRVIETIKQAAADRSAMHPVRQPQRRAEIT